VIFNTAAAAILDFQKFRTFTVSLLSLSRHRAKFHQNWSNGCGDMAIKQFSKWRLFAILDFGNKIFNGLDEHRGSTGNET